MTAKPVPVRYPDPLRPHIGQPGCGAPTHSPQWHQPQDILGEHGRDMVTQCGNLHSIGLPLPPTWEPAPQVNPGLPALEERPQPGLGPPLPRTGTQGPSIGGEGHGDALLLWRATAPGLFWAGTTGRDQLTMCLLVWERGSRRCLKAAGRGLPMVATSGQAGPQLVTASSRPEHPARGHCRVPPSSHTSLMANTKCPLGIC